MKCVKVYFNFLQQCRQYFTGQFIEVKKLLDIAGETDASYLLQSYS